MNDIRTIREALLCVTSGDDCSLMEAETDFETLSKAIDELERLRSRCERLERILHLMTDNYVAEEDCECDRCKAYPEAVAALRDALRDEPSEQ